MRMFLVALATVFVLAGCSEEESGPLRSVDFSYTQASAYAVSFNNTPSNLQSSGLTYHWDFGDLNYSTESAPTHSYAAPGDYTVSLTVTDSKGSVQATKTVTVYPNVYSSSLKSNFQSVIDTAFASKTDVAGVSVAIYKDGYPTWTYARGKASQSASMTTSTPSLLYSITKTMVSAAVLKQIENGDYALTDTLSTVLSGHAALSGFNSQRINLNATVEQLLMHTSGIANYNDNGSGITSFVTNIVTGTAWDPAGLVNLVNTNFSGVGTHQYSDTNYVLLGMIVEHHATGNLAQILDTLFFSSLGIDGALLPQESIPSNLAQPYDDLSVRGGSAVFGNLASADQFFMTGMSASTWAAAGMAMTAGDVAKWGYELYSNNGSAIAPATRTQLLASPTPASSNYGYGVALESMNINTIQKDTYGHGGGGPGYLSRVYYSPDYDVSVVLLLNSNNSTNNSAIDGFLGSDFNLIGAALIEALANG